LGSSRFWNRYQQLLTLLVTLTLLKNLKDLLVLKLDIFKEFVVGLALFLVSPLGCRRELGLGSV